MPYTIRKVRRRRRIVYLIVRKADGQVVGRSTSRRKAVASIRHRMAGETDK